MANTITLAYEGHAIILVGEWSELLEKHAEAEQESEQHASARIENGADVRLRGGYFFKVGKKYKGGEKLCKVPAAMIPPRTVLLGIVYVEGAEALGHPAKLTIHGETDLEPGRVEIESIIEIKGAASIMFDGLTYNLT